MGHGGEPLLPRQAVGAQGVRCYERSGLEAHVVALEYRRDPVEIQEMLVELHEKPPDAVSHRLHEIRRVVQRHAEALVGHDPGEVLEEAATVAGDHPHALRQVGAHVVEGEKVEVLHARPRVALEVLPAHDRPAVLVRPCALLRRSRSRVRGFLVRLLETHVLLEANEIVAHPQPELDERVQVRALGGAVGGRSP